MEHNNKFHTYRLYDYRDFPDEFINEVAIDDQVRLSRLRTSLLCILPCNRSESDTRQLICVNRIIHSIRLLDRNIDDYRAGYRAYRQKASLNNIILSSNYVLILAYEPSNSCCATLYKRDSLIGIMFVKQFGKLCDRIIEDNLIVDNITIEDVEYDGIIYQDKTITLPLLPIIHTKRTKLSKNYHVELLDTDDNLIRSFRNKKELEHFMKQELNGCVNYFDIANTENVRIEHVIDNPSKYQDIEILYERLINMADIFYQCFWKRGNIGCEEFYNAILRCCDVNGEFCSFKWKYAK